MKADLGNLALVWLLLLAKPIRKDKKALAFNMLFNSVATLTVIFTDEDARNRN